MANDYSQFSAFYENMQGGMAPQADLFKSFGQGTGTQGLSTNLADAAKNAQTAEALQKTSAGIGLFSSAMNLFNVSSKKKMYDAQKSMIDANLANQESYLIDRLTENMAQLDVFTAAKNVDIRSQAVQSAKQQAGIDLGEDINAKRRQSNLQKIALDLQYAREKQQATTQLVSSAATAAIAFA